MASSRRIVVEFLGKDVSAGRTADQVEGRMTAIGGKLRKVGAVAATGFAIAGAAAIKVGADSVRAASDMSESLSKVGVVFGRNAEEVLDWSKSSARSFGMSRQAALEASGTIGNLLLSMGNSRKAASEMSTGIVELAADLGSFNNVGTDEVLKAIQSGLTGEIAPLRRFGVNLTDATLKAKALELGLYSGSGALSVSGKSAAAYALILEQTKTAQGDFSRTSSGLANQQKILQAQFEDVKTSIGMKLLPAVVQFMNFVNSDALPGLRRLGTWLSANLGPAFEAVGEVVERITGGMNGDVSKNLTAIQSTFSSVISIWTSLWNRFGGTLLQFLTTTFDNFRKLVSGGLQVISGIFKVFAALLKGDWKGVWEGLKQIASGAFTVLKAVISQALNVIKSLFKVAWSAIKGIVGGVWDGIKGLVSAGASSIVNAVRGIPARIKSLGGSFKAAGRHLIDSMVDGLKNAAGIISGIAGNVWTAVKSLLNGAITRINAALEFKISLPGPDISVNPPNIPHLAKGGVVRARPGGTLALLAEAGHDEAVVPLSGPHAPKLAGSSSTVTHVLDLRLNGRTIRKMLLEDKNLSGVELGLT